MRHIDSRLMNAVIAVAAAAGLGILPGAYSHADPVEDLVEFSAGTTARADEVNANFSEVADSVNDNDTRIRVLEDIKGLGDGQLVISIPFSAFAMSSHQVEWEEDIVTGYGTRLGGTPVAFAYAPLITETMSDQSGAVTEGFELHLTSMEVEACDDTADGSLIVALSVCPVDEDGCVGVAAINTGEANAPGCIFLSDAPDEPLAIDNFRNTYRFVISDTSIGGGNVRTRAIRVFLEWVPPM